MIWKKCTIHTTEEAEDILSMNLAELGIEGVQIEDRMPLTAEDTKGMFVDEMPDFGPDDGTADVSFYVEILHPEEKQDRLAKAAKVASDPSIDASYTPNTANAYTRQEFEELLQKSELCFRTPPATVTSGLEPWISPTQKTRTGSTTGRPIFILSMSTTSS